MTSIVQTTDIITSGNTVINGAGSPQIISGNLFYLTEGTNVISTGGRAFDVNVSATFSYDWIIDGLAYGQTRAFDVYTNTNNIDIEFNVTVGETGTISAHTSYTMYIGSDGANTTGLINISNAGLIQGSNAAPVFLFGTPTITVSNTGTIKTNAIDSSWSNAVFITNVEDGSVFNTGLIETQAKTISSTGFIINDHAAVSVNSSSGTSEYTVTNTGTIRGGSHSVFMSTEISHLVNSGLLDGSVFFDSNTGVGEIFNSGTILGDLRLDNATDTIINSGTISGDVNLNGGADTFDGRGGTVAGTVYGGTGDDTYFVSSTDASLVELLSEGTDTVNSTVNFKLANYFENLTLLGGADTRAVGNALNNTLDGNIGDNRLAGLAGDDTLNGNEGDDRLLGQAGNDVLNGNSGDDVLRGALGNDKLIGDEGDDILRGAKGNDSLYGGAGEDLLLGGRGKDIFYGGDDADTFRFNRTTDSLNNPDFDTIFDFNHGEDKLDLHNIASNLTYIGSSAFSGSGHEVQVEHTVTGNTIVRVNLDGDLIGDFKLDVKNTLLDEGDFIL